jgi:hypothetical protein
MRITSDNLDQTIELNEQIAKQVEDHILLIEKRFIKWQSLPVEEQALEILREHHLIEVPIPDENWGGAIRKFFNNTMVPIINTYQPRLYQYFIYWHEIYHLTEREEMDTVHTNGYEITTEFDLSERKADYFASQMIFRRSDLYEYYHSLGSDDDFIERIAHCMKSFKAPYKAVMIELYQLAQRHRNTNLQKNIKEYFDFRLQPPKWEIIFQENSLDDTLMKPSYVTNLNHIIKTINKEIMNHPDVDFYKENLRLVKEWELKFKKVKAETKGELDGKLP